ncbi:DEAD/DEAH box helicase family protein [Leptobacterium flavescens]|uniref:DEAD/DEAH box helicase family protein n=1 Tax=Leptobacterium flavescens TaxID=472055 RepID=A0A6P0UPZ9_9FLAO|nr:DEAD/DEAH box helicase family protein [Leptobacterium flavescens]NER15037.1 DEAD/DEAH box helicase family protein [Leptobacterium flavescens]
MKQFPSDIKFKYNWRKYQKRVLDELEEHLSDDHLHIVAPPGSGKTVLGLEVTLRLNKPALILAPTIAIRNQWVKRFCELFIQVDQKPDWISKDIHNPKFLTVATYQGLHAACTGKDPDQEQEENEEENGNEENGNGSSLFKTREVIERFKSQNLGVIVVDEAHHLKNAWWNSLNAIKNELKPTVVGLTATPPYDVSYSEWERYLDLNGPVDTEISVPELVIEDDLCPHQDYVFFSQPTVVEVQKIDIHRQRAQKLFNEIKTDQLLIEALEQYEVYKIPDQHLEWIYSNLESYSAILIFLHAAGTKLREEHLEIIGSAKFSVPKLNYEWMETLLTFYLFNSPKSFSKYEDHQQALINKLKRNGVLERRTVNFTDNRKINSFLSSSISKLESIKTIVDFEYNQLKQNLRMVILTDYIRREYLVQHPESEIELDKIGVVPIFEQLRRNNSLHIKLGVLSGSLVIIPETALASFREIASKYGISKISANPLSYDQKYLIINSSDQFKHHIVHIITQLFEKGYIEVLTGTKSLLGEGWDAPSINSLILASFVGSYVQSNQMRGRAIRTDRLNMDKAANIWHLACVDPTVFDGGNDIQLLKRRFRAFVGVSFEKEARIENGIGRLKLPDKITGIQEIEEINNKMFINAERRDLLKEKWKEALKTGSLLIEEIKVPFPEEQSYNKVKSMYYNKTIANMVAILSSLLLAYGETLFEEFIHLTRHIKNPDQLFNWLFIIGVFSTLLFGRLFYTTLRMYIKYRDISKDISQIGKSLLKSLTAIRAIRTNRSKLTVVSHIDDWGAIYCHLEGGTTYEKAVFIKSLQEIIAPPNNPRYLIIRKSFFLKVFSQRDYHSVPEIIGKKKRSSEYFRDQWSQIVGPCELIYTRTIEGRKLLLKSRINSLASQFQDKAERVNRWR